MIKLSHKSYPSRKINKIRVKDGRCWIMIPNVEVYAGKVCSRANWGIWQKSLVEKLIDLFP